MSGIDTQQWARTSPPSAVLLPSCTIYDLKPHIRQVWMLSIPRAVNRWGGTPTHSISKACKSSLCSQETRNIFSFQSWGHKTRLQRRLRRWRSECLKQKQTRWRTSLIPSAPCNPPTRDAGCVHVLCVSSPPIDRFKNSTAARCLSLSAGGEDLRVCSELPAH